MKDFYIYGVLLQLIAIVVSQRVAPGVNPQHYQHNQQYQQQPPPQGNPQYQQQQQYQQQPPVHQQQQQVHQQQVPVQHQQQAPQAHHQPAQGQQQGHGHAQQPQGGHGHGHAAHNAPVLTGNVQAEKEHIAEHMEVPMDTSKMSEQELQFHYFKMHDADNNNKLDGCELIKSLIHWHEEEDTKTGNHTVLTDDFFSKTIDAALVMFDTDDDAYVSYTEYKHYLAEHPADPEGATAPPTD